MPTGCRLSGPGWTLSSIQQFNSTTDLHLPTIDVPTLNISMNLPKDVVNHYLNSPKWEHFKEIKDIAYKPNLPESAINPPIVWGMHSGHIPWSTLIIALCIVVTLLVVFLTS